MVCTGKSLKRFAYILKKKYVVVSIAFGFVGFIQSDYPRSFSVSSYVVPSVVNDTIMFNWMEKAFHIVLAKLLFRISRHVFEV
jgi:hypothetical protein